ncbi:hypothetical protein L6452_11788 [Arctium lappa]|uniref:Uncharacterized protein n=1 Tax=Arctium lappa TaxID=4217 RepID=A0ACB9DQ67_ARCLA|nr:hypothetical protein L6452_11788 [Arctium lappa]
MSIKSYGPSHSVRNPENWKDKEVKRSFSEVVKQGRIMEEEVVTGQKSQLNLKEEVNHVLDSEERLLEDRAEYVPINEMVQKVNKVKTVHEVECEGGPQISNNNQYAKQIPAQGVKEFGQVSGGPGHKETEGDSMMRQENVERTNIEGDHLKKGDAEYEGVLTSSGAEDLSDLRQPMISSLLRYEGVLTSSGAEDLSSLRQSMLKDFFQTHYTFLTKYIVISCISTWTSSGDQIKQVLSTTPF